MMALFRSIAGGCLFFGLAFGCGCSQKQSEESNAIVINEFLASNQSGLEDEDGTKGDWIELKNTSDESVSLGGWSLTDDATIPNKWNFPDVVIGPQAYVVVFASGKDRKATTLHANFKLSSSGEYLGCFPLTIK